MNIEAILKMRSNVRGFGCRAAATATLAAGQHGSGPAGQDLWGAGDPNPGAVARHEVPPTFSGVHSNEGHPSEPAVPSGDGNHSFNKARTLPLDLDH